MAAIITGAEEYVGVIDRPHANPPIRVYYPAESVAGESVGWFVRSQAYYMQGYAHALGLFPHSSVVFQWLIAPLIWLFAAFLPSSYAKLPFTSRNAPFKPASDGSLRPVIIFSHGLTG
jgi:hypothetical protein